MIAPMQLEDLVVLILFIEEFVGVTQPSSVCCNKDPLYLKCRTMKSTIFTSVSTSPPSPGCDEMTSLLLSTTAIERQLHPLHAHAGLTRGQKERDNKHPLNMVYLCSTEGTGKRP